MRELVAGVESQRADPHLSESAEKSVISLSPTHQSTHVNASKHARQRFHHANLARQRFFTSKLADFHI
jgi:hypothetical protein